MKANIAQIAKSTIQAARNTESVICANGSTPDIISEIISVDKISQRDTHKFAEHLKGRNHYETLQNVWQFVKSNIRYIIDPIGVQYIKTPSRIYADGFADCKGYSIFIASILKNLGYNFSYRFASYSKQPIYTHVYIVIELANAHIPGKQTEPGKSTIILDAVLPAFNTEKQYTFKKDIHMSKIVRMEGVGQAVDGTMLKKVINLGNRDILVMTEGEMDLWLARDRFITEKAIVEKMTGIGSLKAEKYQDSIDMLEDAILAVQRATVNGIGAAADPDLLNELSDIAVDATTGKYSIAGEIAGISGKTERKAKRQEKKAKRTKVREDKKTIRKTYKGKEQREKMAEWRAANGTKTGKFLQKVGQKVQKGLKAVGRVLSAPQRLAAKAILEVKLPKAAPMFLYMFVKDPALIEKLPPAARKKREKAQRAANVIIKGVGMKENHFMGIVRNGIMKQMGDSPENIIAKEMKGKVAGIGLIEEAGKAAGGFLTQILDWIIGLFKGKKNKSKEDQDLETEASSMLSEVDSMLPAPSDPDEQSLEVAEAVRTQDTNTLSEEALNSDDSPADDGAGGRRTWSSF